MKGEVVSNKWRCALPAGVSHADDFMYSIELGWSGPFSLQSDMDMRKHMVDMWVTFANKS